MFAEEQKNHIHFIHHLISNLANDLYPLLTTISVLIGFVVLIIGFMRLTKHGKQQNMMRHYSPVSTIFHFIAGAMLISIVPTFQMLEGTFFQNTLEANPILHYAEVSTQTLDKGLQLKSLFFSCAIIIGFISLLRGLILLIKIGEGQQEGSASKVITHIIAGIVGINAHFILTYFGAL
ncbi:hypothetical protein [Facilibium subflavum]|uniref:hypothetical protein n=1 Tax=Facilibium subflavum TaxID=2219058 RepID=UPI000E659C03|nr:hypothetical protein [Facilibium subflavum]